jgi:dTDP-4-dehydrorhamnose 3,5-epimerase
LNIDEITVVPLDTYPTKDVKDNHLNGELTVIWRNWDKIIKTPEMVYVNSVNPGEIKGPHIHKNRTSYFLCLQGKMIIVIRDKNKKYHEIETNSTESKLISVSNGTPAAIINPSKNISKILVLADVAWKPNDNEMENTTFDDYDWNKWKKEHII